MTSDDTCVRAPARLLTAVCDVPPPAGIAPKSPPRRVADTQRQQLLVRVRRRLASLRERPPCGDRFSEAHERDPERAGPEHQDHAGVRQRHARQPGGMAPTVSTPIAFNPSRAEAAIPRITAASGDGARGTYREMRSMTPIVTVARTRVGGDVWGRAAIRWTDGLKYGSLVQVQPKQLGYLVHDDHDANPGFESSEHGL